MSMDFHDKLKSLHNQKMSKLQPMTQSFQATFGTNKIQYNHSFGFHCDGIYSVFIGINIGLE